MKPFAPPAPKAREDTTTGLARGGAINLLGAVTSGAFGLVLVVVVTRTEGLAGAGALFEAIALFSILFKSAQLGAGTGLVRFFSTYRALDQVGALRRCAGIALVPPLLAGSLAGGLLFIVRHPLADLLAHGAVREQLASYLGALAPFVPVATLYMVLESATRGFGTMTPAVVVERIARPLAQPVLILLIAAGDFGPEVTALAWAAPYGAGLVALAVWLPRRIHQEEEQAGPGPEVPGPVAIATAFWRFTAPRALAGVFQVSLLWLDTLLVGALVSTEAAGLYTVSTRFVFAAMLVALCIAQVLQPQIGHLLARRELDRANEAYRTATTWLVAFTWPLHLSVMVFAPVLLSVFGSDYRQGSTVLVILASSFLVATAAGPVDVVLLMGGRSRANLINTAAALVVNVGLNLLLLPRYGITGAAVAWAASVVLNNVVPVLQVRRVPGLSPFGPGLACAARLTVTAFLPVGLVLRATLGATAPAFALHLAVGAAIYLPLLWRRRHTLQLTAFQHLLPFAPALQRPRRQREDVCHERGIGIVDLAGRPAP